MTEYADTLLEESRSDFIVRTCQLLPKSFATDYDRIYIPTPFSLCRPVKYFTYCGSSQEFYIRPMNPCIEDVDVLECEEYELAFIEDFPVFPADLSNLADIIKFYGIEPCPGYPGFVRLRDLGTMRYNWKMKMYEFSQTTFQYICSGLHMSAYISPPPDDSLLSPNDLEKLTQIRKGPALKLQNKAAVVMTLDIVPSIWCHQWPREVQDWLTRRRVYGWPSADVISDVVQRGCHVVYAQHRACREDKLQWRYSFSVAERILLKSWTKIQQIVYHLLRYFAKKEIIQSNCSKNDEIFCAYHIKTLMLWTCEEKSPEWWNFCSVIAICRKLLRTLSEWLKRKRCPNYFIPEANLFHEQWTDDMCKHSNRQLDRFCEIGVLCDWFWENYIFPFIHTRLDFECSREATPCFSNYMLGIYQLREENKLKLVDSLFSSGLSLYCNDKPERTKEPRSGLVIVNQLRNQALLASADTPIQPAPEKVWCFKYYEKTLYCLNFMIYLMHGHISWDSELFSEYVTGITMTQKIIRCQYHTFPKPTAAEKSQSHFLRAHDYLESLSGFNSKSEFKLLFYASEASLRKSLNCNDSQSESIAPAALVYLASLKFANSEYQQVMDMCLAVLTDQTIHTNYETLNAGCLFFIDDVIRIVGFSLLCRRLGANIQLSTRKIYLDLRLTFSVFAFHLTVISAERMSINVTFSYDLGSPEFPLDRLLLVITKRKYCSSRISSICCNDMRGCVYNRTASLNTKSSLNVGPSIATEEFTDGLMECTFENMSLFYNMIEKEFDIQCNPVNCYRALYLYKCCRYDAVFTLSERILCEPRLKRELEISGFANVTVLPRLNWLFDEDMQSLLGFYALLKYLRPLDHQLVNAVAYEVQRFGNSMDKKIIAKLAKGNMPSLQRKFFNQYHSFVGRPFLARYLKLRCVIDCNRPFTEAVIEFASMNCKLQLERIIRQFMLRKLFMIRILPEGGHIVV